MWSWWHGAASGGKRKGANTMSSDVEPFGAQLYGELRKLSGYDVITDLLDYKAIPQRKQAAREATVKLFSKRSYKALQQIKTKAPKEVAHYLAKKAKVLAVNENRTLML